MNKTLTDRVKEWNTPKQILKNLLIATATGIGSAYGQQEFDIQNIFENSCIAYTTLSVGLPVVYHTLASVYNCLSFKS
ncbi:hypothetical protein KY342_01225 [Candidatus Woesearchaeota archaeon]|nr:hypothetical protein [Candidatus Woesearchaeota archaeon]